MSDAFVAKMATFGKRLEVLPVRGGRPTVLFQVAVIVWIVFAVACGVKAVISPVKHNSFAVFEAGSELFLADLDMYFGTHHEFRYGPAFAFLFVPLTLLPESLGSLIWMWLNLAAFFWSLRTLARELLPGTWKPDQEATLLLLALAPSFRGLWTAQTNVLILACVVAALVAIARQRWWWAALALALPVHIKVWPIAAALLVVAWWPRQLTARFATAVMAVAALPCLVKSPGVVWARYEDWHRSLTGPMQTRHVYRDMWTLLEAFQVPDRTAYAVLQLSTGILVLALCLWQKEKRRSWQQLATFLLGIWAAWQMLFGPGTERATFGLLAPLTAWGVITAQTTSRGRGLMFTAFSLTVLGSLSQVERALLPIFPLAQALHPLGVILFAVWLVEYARDWRSMPLVRPLRASLWAGRFAQPT